MSMLYWHNFIASMVVLYLKGAWTICSYIIWGFFSGFSIIRSSNGLAYFGWKMKIIHFQIKHNLIILHQLPSNPDKTFLCGLARQAPSWEPQWLLEYCCTQSLYPKNRIEPNVGNSYNRYGKRLRKETSFCKFQLTTKNFIVLLVQKIWKL